MAPKTAAGRGFAIGVAGGRSRWRIRGGRRAPRGQNSQKSQNRNQNQNQTAAATLLASSHSLPRFRHLGFVVQTRVACLVYCCEVLRARRDSESVSPLLAALPPEIVEIIGRYIVVGSEVARFTHPERLKCVATLRGHKGFIESLAILTNTDGTQLLASASDDHTIKLWDLSSRECIATLEGHTGTVESLVPLSDTDGVPLLASADSSSVILWDAVNHTQLMSFYLRDGARAYTLTASTNARGLPYLAFASSGGGHARSITVWNWRTRREVAPIQKCTNDSSEIPYRFLPVLHSLAFFSDPAGADFLVGGSDNRIDVWDMANYERAFVLEKAASRELAGGSSDESSSASSSGSSSGSDSDSDSDSSDLSDSSSASWSGRVSCLTCFTNGDGVPILVSSHDDSTVKVWDLVLRVEIASLEAPKMSKSLLCTAGADGRVILAACSPEWDDGLTSAVRLLDLSTGRRVFQEISQDMATMSAVCTAVDRTSGELFLVTAGARPKMYAKKLSREERNRQAGTIQLWTQTQLGTT
jgi:WD40 repeat protein